MARSEGAEADSLRRSDRRTERQGGGARGGGADPPALKGPRVSVLAVFALIIAAASALVTLAMFFGAGCVQGLEVSTMGTEILRDAPVYHPFFSWTAVAVGGGAQIAAILIAIAARRAIRRSQGRIVGSGVALTAILLAVTTLAASPPAFSCGTRIADARHRTEPLLALAGMVEQEGGKTGRT
ncbi:MAG: hypothetical protein HYY06_31965 [Deltaproteobacteria bacterium]|nr:hypothetical protein [Deltaproteobacteria bacterium]